MAIRQHVDRHESTQSDWRPPSNQPTIGRSAAAAETQVRSAQHRPQCVDLSCHCAADNPAPQLRRPIRTRSRALLSLPPLHLSRRRTPTPPDGTRALLCTSLRRCRPRATKRSRSGGTAAPLWAAVGSTRTARSTHSVRTFPPLRHVLSPFTTTDAPPLPDPRRPWGARHTNLRLRTAGATPGLLQHKHSLAQHHYPMQPHLHRCILSSRRR